MDYHKGKELVLAITIHQLYPSFSLSLLTTFPYFTSPSTDRKIVDSVIRPICSLSKPGVGQRAHNSTIGGSELIMDLSQIAAYVWQGYGSLTYCRSGYEGCQVPKYQHAVVDITPNLKIAVH